MATNYNNNYTNYPNHAQPHLQAPRPLMTTTGYPPQQDGMYATLNSTTTLETKVADDPRLMNRTPSPTPSEARELKTGAIDWKQISSTKFWFRREWLWYYVILVVILVVTALVTLYHTQIVDWLTPFTKWLHGLKLGWLVPIGILFVISFPPLFGHEIVAILCGLVWGLWAGFGIVAAGTFLGEVGNFYAFKYCCRARGEKMERTKISYACLARVVRDGGFKIALIARLSAIPGHFTTAIFSTCGMGIIVFSIAAILSLPKQFITVYLGVILAESNSGTEDTKSKIISDVVLAITFIVTVVAMWYILRQMNKVKPQVIYERRKARQQKLLRAGNGFGNGSSPYGTSSAAAGSSMTSVNEVDVFNPNGSDSDIPLTSAPNGLGGAGPSAEPRYQQWDRHGNAVGYVADPILHTPQPRVPVGSSGNALLSGKPSSSASPPASGARYPRDEEEAGGVRPGPVVPTREDSGDSVGWDTGRGGDPSRQQFLPPPGSPPRAIPPRLAGEVGGNAMHNPYSPGYQKTSFAPESEAVRTPTQASFVNSSSGLRSQTGYATQGHSGHHPQVSYDDPYGGYASVSEPTYSYGHGHAQESTDASYGTAYTSSPVEDGEEVSHTHRIPPPQSQSHPAGLVNPHEYSSPNPGQFAPPPGPPPPQLQSPPQLPQQYTGSNNPYFAAAVPAQQQHSSSPYQSPRAQSPNAPPSYAIR